MNIDVNMDRDFADATGGHACSGIDIPTDVAEGYTDLLTICSWPSMATPQARPDEHRRERRAGRCADTALSHGDHGRGQSCDGRGAHGVLQTYRHYVRRRRYNKALATFNAANIRGSDQSGWRRRSGWRRPR